MANKRWQRLKAIVRSRGKRHDERFVCHCCKVVHDRGWTYTYEGVEYYFCPQCKEKLKVGHMPKNMMATKVHQDNRDRHIREKTNSISIQ